MYPGTRARTHPDQAAFLMAATGETVTYGELERRPNRPAHYLRRQGLVWLDPRRRRGPYRTGRATRIL